MRIAGKDQVPACCPEAVQALSHSSFSFFFPSMVQVPSLLVVEAAEAAAGQQQQQQLPPRPPNPHA